MSLKSHIQYGLEIKIKLISLPQFHDDRGSLVVLERMLPFSIKRAFSIYNLKENRGGHRHHKSIHAIWCVHGNCKILINNGLTTEIYALNSPDKCLLIAPQDWREMYDFAPNTVLMCVSSEFYNPDDYVYELP